MLQGRRICITGGAGFIGSHLIERLAPKNRLVVFDNYHRDALTGAGLASDTARRWVPAGCRYRPPSTNRPRVEFVRHRQKHGLSHSP